MRKVSVYFGRIAEAPCSCYSALLKGRKSGKRKRTKTIGAPEYVAHLAVVAAKPAVALGKLMRREAKRVAEEITKKLDMDKLRKGTLTEAQIDQIIKHLSFKDFDDDAMTLLREALRNEFIDIAKDSAVGVGSALDGVALDQVSQEALAWARERSAYLVGKKVLDDGSVVDNPNAAYSISEEMRNGLRNTVSDGLEEGLSPQALAGEIRDGYAFSKERATTIARTELAFAHTNGNIAGWDASGVVEGKESILGSEHDMDDDCNDNADAGVLKLDEDFPSGDIGPPYHPNCVCALLPVVMDEQPADQPEVPVGADE